MPFARARSDGTVETEENHGSDYIARPFYKMSPSPVHRDVSTRILNNISPVHCSWTGDILFLQQFGNRFYISDRNAREYFAICVHSTTLTSDHPVQILYYC